MSKACLSGSGSTVSVTSFFGDVEQPERSSGLVRRRSSRFSAKGFLTALLYAAHTGKSLLNQLAMQMAGDAPISMSRQAMHKHFDRLSTRFMELALHEVILHKLCCDGSAARNSADRDQDRASWT